MNVYLKKIEYLYYGLNCKTKPQKNVTMKVAGYT